MHLDVKSDIPVLLSVRMLKKQFEHKVVLNELNLDLYFKENLVVMGKSGTVSYTHLTLPTKRIV